MTKLLPCIVLLLASSGTCQRDAKGVSKSITFTGVVERIDDGPGGVSGGIAVYRLVKYWVERVCLGEYGGREMVVDHLILSGEELKGLKVGDRVCVTVERSGKVLLRYDAEGIRDPSEDVKTFFVAEAVAPAPEDSSCNC